MSHLDIMDDDEDVTAPPRRNRRRRRKRRRFGSVIAVLLSLAVVGGVAYGIYYGGSRVFDQISGFFGPSEDYPGPGSGSVEVTIPDGASLRTMGDTLAEAGVVASQGAFEDAAAKNPDSGSIQAGTYQLKKEMKAADAVDAMLAATQIVGQAGVPEGLRVRQIVERIAEDTSFEVVDLQAAVEGAELPDYAEGDPEGFLFPATYHLKEDTDPAGLVRMMVNRFGRAADEIDLQAAAQKQQLTVREMVTVASIIQREVRRPEDMPRVADVIYNRISGACRANGVPQGRLQMDSTVHYALDDYSSVYTSAQQRQVDSPYNTYLYPGLPPGPIAAPGQEALSAAANPAGGQDCYFVAVNLDTGETAFAVTQAEHNANRARLEQFCSTSDLC